MVTRARPPDTAARVFKALGSPARLAIARTLVGGERCVCDLVEACGLGWSTTSRHLEVLREAGVVSSEKRAQKIFYRLDLACVADFIRCLDGVCKTLSYASLAVVMATLAGWGYGLLVT